MDRGDHRGEPWVLGDTFAVANNLVCHFSKYCSMSVKYAVVHFPEENGVEVAPLSWVQVKDGKTVCYWPKKGTFKGAALTLAVKKGLPRQVDWGFHPAEVLKETGQLIYH